MTQGLDAFFYLFLTYRHDNPYKIQNILILTAKTLDNATNGGLQISALLRRIPGEISLCWAQKLKNHDYQKHIRYVDDTRLPACNPDR